MRRWHFWIHLWRMSSPVDFTQDKCGDDSEDRSLRAKKAFKKLDLNGSGNVRSMAALVICVVCLCLFLDLNLYEYDFCLLDIACKWSCFWISMIMTRSTHMFWFRLFIMFIDHEYQAPKGRKNFIHDFRWYLEQTKHFIVQISFVMNHNF